MALLAVAGGPFTATTAAVAAEPRLQAIGERLVRAYPDHLAGVEGRDLVWRDGTRMPLDDGTGSKSHAARLENADIEDQFADAYSPGRNGVPPMPDADPGRYRHGPFFLKMYGDCESASFQATLETVVWLPKAWGGTIRVTRINGIADRLRRVSHELDGLDARFLAFLHPPAGTVSCRRIAGSSQRSMHAYGAAIDIALPKAHYWRWDKPEADGRRAWRNAIPPEIVDVFERHGFIWGGKWHHYDTMHFEYRPELLP